MALPTLDATFASAADLPRKYMLSRWLVGELGSGSIANYVTLPERYLWAKIAVAAGAPLPEANYISLPKQYVWKAIYDAVSGSSAGTIDWVEKQALGHIAAAYRGDTGNPANLATYIDWPWRYQVASIIGAIGATFPSEELLAFWKFDNLNDSSGNGYSLTNTNNVTFTAGKIGNAATFDGSNYLGATIPNLGSDDWSVSCWAKTPTLEEQLSTVWMLGTNSGEESTGRVGLLFWDDGSIQVLEDGSWVLMSSSSWSANTWIHCVVTKESGQIKMYLDNVLEDTNTVTGFVTSQFLIGRPDDSDTAYLWDDKIDALGIWSRAISESEITQLYNNGSGIEI